MNKFKLAVVHNLAVGGAKRILHSIMQYLPEHFDIKVHEFEDLNKNIFDIAGETIKCLKYKAPEIPTNVFWHFPLVGLKLKWRALRKAYKPMADSINKDNPDCVLVNHCRYLQSPVIMPMIEKPIVYFCHEPPRSIYEPRINREYYIRNYPILEGLRALNAYHSKNIDKRNVSFATRILTSSFYSAEVLYRVYGTKASVVHPGVDTKIFSSKNTKRCNNVLSVGSLNPIKNHDFAIRSVGLVNSKIRPTLTIVCPKGTALEKEKLYLERIAETQNVEIIFLTAIDDHELAELYRQSLATIYCPHLEPFGLVSLESMACGTPILGVNEGGLREAVKNGITGYLLPWNEKKFANKIEDLFANEDLLNRLSVNCVKWAKSKQWNWSHSAEKVTEVINETIIQNKEKQY